MQLFHFPRSLAGLARAGLAFIMLAMALLGSARPASAAGFVSATAVGSGIQFHGQNGVPITWSVSVSVSAIDFSGSIPVFPAGATVKGSSTPGTQTTFDPFVGGLFPNTTFNYIVRADGTYHTGSVKTKQRSMTITFNQFTISNDSDSTGAGELKYHFRVAGVYRSALDFRKDVSSPTSFTVSQTVPGLLNGLPSVPLAVEVQDDDCTFSTCFRTADFTSGSDADNDWATAKFTISSLSDQTNTVSKTVTFSVNGAVGFTVSALVQVAYF
jgi:hypothetical protein